MRPSPELLVLAAGRLPQGRFGGSLAQRGAASLGVDAVSALMRPLLPRLPMPPRRLIWGMARSHGQGMNPARTIALKALQDQGTHVYAHTVNMACGAGLQAVILAAEALAMGEDAPTIAGGSECMSNNPFLLPDLRWGYRFGHHSVPDVMHHDGLRCPVTGLLMGQIIERMAGKLDISREAMDAYALESHRRAAAADFRDEHLAHPALDRDECIRPANTLEALANLKPVFEKQGTITAGNASAISDGAAALLLARPEQAGDLPALARIRAWTEVALDPLEMGETPIPAVRALLQETGLKPSDIALWELNEAFAVQVLFCARELGIPMDRLNVAGGAISLGHPIGATGARILVTLIHQLRHRGGGLGIATLGIGGGLGQAMLVEV